MALALKRQSKESIDQNVINVLKQAKKPLKGGDIQSSLSTPGPSWTSPGDVAQSVWRLERAGKVEVDKSMSVSLVEEVAFDRR